MNALTLSPWQMQTIVNIGIDAWYLTPLRRNKTVSDVASNDFEQFVEDLQKPIPIPLSHKQSKPLTTLLPAVDSVASSVPPKMTNTLKASQRQRKEVKVPDRINIEIVGGVKAPEEGKLPFAFSTLPDLNWDVLEQESQQYAEKAGQPCFHGIGKRDAQDFLLLPPPEPLRKEVSIDKTTANLGLSDREQHLLREMFVGIGLDVNTSYQTCLVKNPTAYGQNPDTSNIHEHLALLASELALVMPKRIWVFGSLASQTMTQSFAPLSELVDKSYSLCFKGLDGETQSSHIIFLPTLDYLLALPAEKGKVWQQIKRFI